MCEMCIATDSHALHEAAEADSKKIHQPITVPVSRRGFLRMTAGALGAGVFAAQPALASVVVRRERALSIYSPNTGETIRVVYWIPGEGYIRESLVELSRTLRDHRNDQVKIFDPHLLDQLYALQLQLEFRDPVHVISGYRSPETNAMLRRQNRRVARDSYHTRAQAMDIRMPGRNVADLHRAAVGLNAGGVGYYPRNRFIHIDTGDVRRWS